MRILPGVSCERIAAFVGEQIEPGVRARTDGRCWVESVECFEHGANSALWRNPEATLKQVSAELLERMLAGG